MRSCRRVVWVGLLVFIAGQASAAERTRVVVMPLSTPENLNQLGSSVSEQLTTELSNRGELEVVSANDLQLLMGLDRQRQLTGCSESTCLAEISNALGAPWIVSGSLAQFGQATRLDLKLIRASDGKAFFREGANIQGESSLFEIVSGMARRMMSNIGVSKASAQASAARAGPVALIIAGGALAVGGGVLLGVEAAQRGATVSSLSTSSANPPTYTAARDALTAQGTLMLVGGLAAGVGAVLAAGGVVWAVMPDSSTTVALSVGPGSINVRGAF
ncbi:MAG: hypothetical protein U0228_23630 [Myxococcaceae bacterium]